MFLQLAPELTSSYASEWRPNTKCISNYHFVRTNGTCDIRNTNTIRVLWPNWPPPFSVRLDEDSKTCRSHRRLDGKTSAIYPSDDGHRHWWRAYYQRPAVNCVTWRTSCEFCWSAECPRCQHRIVVGSPKSFVDNRVRRCAVDRDRCATNAVPNSLHRQMTVLHRRQRKRWSSGKWVCWRSDRQCSDSFSVSRRAHRAAVRSMHSTWLSTICDR